MEYKQKAILSFYLIQSLKEKITNRAIAKAIEAGWNGEIGKEKVGKKPNISGTITELLEIGFTIIENFGDDWRDNLAVQSEPVWAKKFFDRLESKIENLSVVGIEKQVNEIEEVYPDGDIDLEGMLE